MTITWNESFILGIDEIDEQHRMIVEHFARLSEAVQDGSEKDLLEELATFLVEYAQLHFATEERYMRQYDYPKIDEQLQEHADFTLDALELQKKVSEEGASHKIAVALTGKMLRWVIQHVRNHDRVMVDFVKKQMLQVA